MSIALAATWNPRGELERFVHLLPQLAESYSSLAIIIPPVTKKPPLAELECSSLVADGRLAVKVAPAWPQGRFLSLKTALESRPDFIHYADMDRLLRWMETRPGEWIQTLRQVESHDVLIIGRTVAAYATHPQAMVKTEAISNHVVSSYLGQPMDVSAGSKSFSRRAVETLLANAQPAFAMGADAEWPILLHRSGFRINYIEVDGLDWESADRFRASAADPDIQQQIAAAYDASPQSWAYRVEIASEIVQVALDAVQRPLFSVL